MAEDPNQSAHSTTSLYHPYPRVQKPRDPTRTRTLALTAVAFVFVTTLAFGLGRWTATPLVGGAPSRTFQTGPIPDNSPTATVVIPPESGGPGWTTILAWHANAAAPSNNTGRFLIPDGKQARVTWTCTANGDAQVQPQCVAEVYTYVNNNSQRVMLTTLVNQYGGSSGSFSLPSSQAAAIYDIQTDMVAVSATINVQVDY